MILDCYRIWREKHNRHNFDLPCDSPLLIKSFSVLKKDIKSFIQDLILKMKALSFREKCFFAVMIIIIGGSGLIFSVQKVQSAFTAQFSRLDQAEQDLQALTAELERYARLIHKKKMVEESYQKIQIKTDSDPSSYLENLFKEVAGISPIAMSDPVKSTFGGHYEKASYGIKNIRVTDMETFTDLLTQLVSGDKPFLIDQIRMQKSRSSASLIVNLDISTIRDTSAT